jgi:hypothetical protein
VLLLVFCAETFFCKPTNIFPSLVHPHAKAPTCLLVKRPALHRTLALAPHSSTPYIYYCEGLMSL